MHRFTSKMIMCDPKQFFSLRIERKYSERLVDFTLFVWCKRSFTADLCV